MDSSIFHLPREDSQPNRRVISTNNPKLRRKKRARSAYSAVWPSRLMIRLEHGNRKGEPSQGPIHSKKPQQNELELEILQGENNPQSRSIVKVLYV